MELNEIFYKAKKHLLTQNAKSGIQIEGSPKLSCMYKDGDGRKCAVGIFFLDDERTDYVGCEWSGLGSMPVQSELIRAGVLTQQDCNLGAPYSKFDLLRNLQHIHDTHEVEYWPTAINQLQKEFGIPDEGGVS
jgi:hypothetical protein